MTTISNIQINIERLEASIKFGFHTPEHKAVLQAQIVNYQQQLEKLENATYTLRNEADKTYFVKIKGKTTFLTMNEADATRLSAEEAHKMRFKLAEQNFICEENFASNDLNFKDFCKSL